MRSVVVVFPASMWAMMPMLRSLASSVLRGIGFWFSEAGDKARDGARRKRKKAHTGPSGCDPWGLGLSRPVLHFEDALLTPSRTAGSRRLNRYNCAGDF